MASSTMRVKFAWWCTDFFKKYLLEKEMGRGRGGEGREGERDRRKQEESREREKREGG